jgi:cyclohexyl-isocyanide hydratase
MQGEGLMQIYLTVIATNHRAKRLYSSEGFISISLERDSIQMSEGEFVDEETMMLYL